MYGLGITRGQFIDCQNSFMAGIFRPSCWGTVESGPTVVAPPGAPTGDALTLPPASGADAQATVDALLNQQLADQQKVNAAGVSSSWWDSTVGGVYSVGSSAVSGFPWGWLAIGVGAVALVAFGGGSPRRYGR